MVATRNGAVFTEDELMSRRSGEKLVKYDAPTRRTISYDCSPFNVHRLSIEGRGVPGEVLISCDVEYVNVLARVLLEADYDARLVNV